MKTTIKTGICSSLTVQPGAKGMKLALNGITDTVAVVDLTPDQAGALIFGIEQALEAAGIQRDLQQAA